LKEYRAIPGNRGVRVLRRIDGEQAEFLLISLWDDYAAIRAFAGDDPERAVYYTEDDAYLLHKEPTVSHYEVVFEDGE
jgi:heme-degrading monooxygenase HmoA